MIRHKDDTELENIYIGSTTNFKVRKYNHKMSCCNPNNKNYNNKKYQYIRDNGGWNEWLMIWLEDFRCNSKRELELREDQVMLQYQNRLNINRAYRTHKEYCNDNKEFIKKLGSEYYQANKEHLIQYRKDYYENNKGQILEKVKQYRKNNKEKMIERDKIKYQKNKDKIAEYKREYYKKNKEKIDEKNKEKIKCNICGFESTRHHLARHQQTKKCQSHLTNS